MKIGIVGWGVEGQSAYRYFGPDHQYLIVSEEPRDDFPQESDSVKVRFLNQAKPPGVTGNVEDTSYLQGLESCDKVIYTPTAYFSLKNAFGEDSSFWDKAVTVQHIFFEEVKTQNIIGVTGTKGKGTTSTLIVKMLEAAGAKVFFGGNVGRSVLDFLKDVSPKDWVVLELSNFQLHHFPYSPHIAVCLMIVPEHQDWHPDMQDYVESKANIFMHQSPEDIAVYFATDEHSKKIAEYSAGRKIPYYQSPGGRIRADGMIIVGEEEREILPKNEVGLLGEHNLQNICAAITAVWFGLSSVEPQTLLDTMPKILTSFSGLEHRLEFVREVGGAKYYDDSFGTTPETAIVALKSFSRPKILILGGSDKGASYESLADEVIKGSVRHVVAIGETGPKISSLLRQKGFSAITEGASAMPEIVAAAQKASQPGDIVLLSTGSASFGLFQDYKDRGNQFKSAVKSLS